MMKALQIVNKGRTAYVNIPVPTLKAGQVLVKIQKVGYCGSDLNSFRGINPLVNYPVIPGHEISGIIEKVGDNVPGQVAVGKQVAVLPQTACGQCASCRNQRFNACEFNQTLGVQRNGALTEYLVLPWEKVIVDDSLLLTQLALLEPLAVGFHAAKRGRIKADEFVVVLGCGVIGLGAIAGAAALGAKVIAVDLFDQKLDKAKAAGASFTINSKTQDVIKQIKAMTNQLLADVVIEAVGHPATYRQAIDLASFTGRVVYVGYATERVAFDTKFFVLKELDIMGSRGSDKEDFENVLKAVKSGFIDPTDIVSHEVDFEKAATALEMWADDPSKVTKILIHL